MRTTVLRLTWTVVVVVRSVEAATILQEARLMVNEDPSAPGIVWENTSGSHHTTREETSSPEEDHKEEEDGEEDWGDFEETPPPEEDQKEEEDGEEDWGDFEETPPPEERSNAIRVSGRVRHSWPASTIPYEVHGASVTKRRVMTALNTLEKLTHLTFTRRTGEARYLLVKEGADGGGGCRTSSSGLDKEVVVVSLGPGCNVRQRIVDEVLQAAGILQERVELDHHLLRVVVKSNSKGETNNVLWESKSAEGGNEDAHIWKPLELKPPGQEGVKVDLALEERDLDVEEGDVEVQPPEELRDARGVTNTIRPWPNAIVPYVIWGSNKTKEIVTSALRNIEDNTCVKFKKRAGEARYLLIKSGSGGCWTSSLGYPSYDKKVTINLGKGCVKPGRIRHEIFHSLGFPHEHARPDRDQYIIIKWNNIKDGASSQFKVDNRFPTLQVPYDVKSIMHYGKFAFTKDSWKPTIVPDPWVDGPLGSSTLSWRDKKKVNIFYNCN